MDSGGQGEWIAASRRVNCGFKVSALWSAKWRNCGKDEGIVVFKVAYWLLPVTPSCEHWLAFLQPTIRYSTCNLACQHADWILACNLLFCLLLLKGFRLSIGILSQTRFLGVMYTTSALLSRRPMSHRWIVGQDSRITAWYGRSYRGSCWLIWHCTKSGFFLLYYLKCDTWAVISSVSLPSSGRQLDTSTV